LFKRHVYWDMNQESDGEGECKGYTVKLNVEAFKGRCDLSHEGPAAKVEDCCVMCNAWRKKGCRGFTHMHNGCWLKTCSDVSEDQMLSVADATGGWLNS
tara:strand:- start:157 stop:453 length:297 start_codon:yes stop_codon:yes gene_type:complete